MRKTILLCALLCAALSSRAAEETSQQTIRVNTEKTDLVLGVAPNGRLYQVYLGDRLAHAGDAAFLTTTAAKSGSHEAYECAGTEGYFEPALAITHADGNQTTYLYYKSHAQHAIEGGTETVIKLADKAYPVEVTLHYAAYTAENVIKMWSEVTHREKRPVTLWRYASGMLHFDAEKYILTNYPADWGREGLPSTRELGAGKTVVDTKLGSRAAMIMEPFFQLAFGQQATETSGRVLLGTVGWTGNFRFTFEVDNAGALRVLPGINPFASHYQLKAGETFTTPEFVFTLTDGGTGAASRNLHQWARMYQVKDGRGKRMTLLNNWENTYFRFDQAKLEELMDDAADLGVEMFLLDDGWFANKYPRKNDRAGLGDWEPTATKLPGGIHALTEAAKKSGVKFGLWIEPEMVNPKSELYEKHPDWAIELPNRDTYYYRHQLVLDLSNPQVQDFVFGVVDRLMQANPEIAYFKWDCNSPITNVYSQYLGQRQGNLYIDHVRGLYAILDRIQAKYPDLPMMLCSGGGGRCDYKALKYFTEFWCSDNTDPYERLYIQWGLSRFFPAKAMAAHVTDWNRRASIKFRTDVASMCRLGFDINLRALSADEREFVRIAVKNYDRLRPVILDGEQYRLVSPHEGHHAAVNYVAQDRSRAVVLAYDLHPTTGEPLQRVRLAGLDPDRRYTASEINLMPGAKSSLACNGQTYTGDYLMKVGIDLFTCSEGASHVVELTGQR